MKLLTHPIQIRIASLLVSWIIRAWGGSLNWRFVVRDPSILPRHIDRRALYLFWHETILLPAYSHTRQKIPILVSTHRDGELITQVIRMLGGLALRGSSTRGGARAVREMLREAKLRHLALTPDGPLGPRRQIQDGAVYLASRAQLPVVPAGFACSACRRAKSWDRMIIPRPFADAWCVVGEPIDVPEDLTRDQLSQYRSRIQRAMDAVQAQAEDFAAGRRRRSDTMSLRQVQ